MRRLPPALASALAGLALAVSPNLVGEANAAEQAFRADPKLGNSTFTAVFDAALGERITAVSSAIGCTLVVDEAALSGTARCSVPLASIHVDADDTKTEHFAEWATNKKLDPAACSVELEVSRVLLGARAEPRAPAQFVTEGRFTICGRARDDGGAERITGSVIELPPGSHGDRRTLRIRARIEGFDRERYGVSPQATAGWKARIQQLANVVAVQGTIDVNVFAAAEAPASEGGAE